MKKIITFLFVIITALANAQTEEYYIKAFEVLETEGVFVIGQDTFLLTAPADGEILKKVSGKWINTTSSFIDSLLKSKDALFLNPSDDSLSSQLAIKTFVLQSITDSIGLAVNKVFEKELTDAENNIDVGFNLASNTLVFYNGNAIKNSLWSGEGTQTINLSLETKQYDFLKIKK